jgi:NADP-reducing hydrogenase subunit HndB
VFEAGKEKVTYVKVDVEKAKRIAKEHLKEGNVVAEYVIKS